MQAGDLTTLASAKSWLNIATSTDDALLNRLISSTSQFIQSWLNRTFAVATQTEIRNGTGTPMMVFGDYPVVGVASVTIDGTSIPLSPDGIQAGYRWDSRTLYLIGYNFRMANQNVVLVYTYGYQKTKEAEVVPASPYLYPVASLSLPWAGDVSVNFANAGATLTKVTGVPTTGQYALSAVNGAYAYLFAAADVGKSVELTYSYTPYEIEQACIELLSIRYRERSRIGENSKSIGGEVVSYNVKDMPDSVKTILMNYRRFISVY